MELFFGFLLKFIYIFYNIIQIKPVLKVKFEQNPKIGK